MQYSKLTIIGCGNMGAAFAEGLLSKKVFDVASVTVTDAYEEGLKKFAEKWLVATTADNVQAVKNADVVLLAVKPQQLRDVLGLIKDALKKDALLFSIAAGFSIASIADAIGKKDQPIVRVMPNLAAKVGKSVSAWIPNAAVTDEQKSCVKAMLGAIGIEFTVTSEEKLDAVTALSGSGPAYFYYFVESLIEAGKALGFSEEEAGKLAIQTFHGAAALLAESGKTPGELRAAVTSKGGTTEAAVSVFEEKTFFDVVQSAMRAAKKRAETLRT